MKALIIDNDSRLINQIRQTLEADGHLAVDYADADQALRQGRNWRPEVVFVNSELPACWQGDLLDKLARLPDRPAIILTASLERFDLAWRAWQLGGDEVVFKPLFGTDEVHRVILTARQKAITGREYKPFAQAA
jgi:DNA-binding response OmpR family regulator